MLGLMEWILEVLLLPCVGGAWALSLGFLSVAVPYLFTPVVGGFCVVLWAGTGGLCVVVWFWFWGIGTISTIILISFPNYFSLIPIIQWAMLITMAKLYWKE